MQIFWTKESLTKGKGKYTTLSKANWCSIRQTAYKPKETKSWEQQRKKSAFVSITIDSGLILLLYHIIKVCAKLMA